MKPLPDINLLREVLTYCPESGVLRWKVKRRGGKKAGDVAGGLGHGYVMVSINNKLYYGHRIAWALYYGEAPELYIDHKDGDKSNNRISNLRLATRSENNHNMPRQKNNTSGQCGVYYNKAKKKWEATLGVKGKRINLGAYECKEEAINARLKAEADNNIYVRAS